MGMYIKKKDLVQKLKTSVVAMILICIFGFNSYNCDMWAYIKLYNRVAIGETPGGVEKGFLAIMNVAARVGLNYEQFLVLFSIMGMVILVKGIGYFTPKVSVVLMCYFIFPFFLDVIQIRNYMAMAISIYAFHFLLDKSKKGMACYVLCILTAASFHNLSYIYLLYVLFYLDEEMVEKYIVPALWCGGMLFILVSDKVFELLSYFAPNIRRYIGEGINGTANATKVMYILYFVFVWIIFEEVKKGYKKKDWQLTDEKKIVCKMSNLSSLFIFFMVFDVDFFRVYRNILPIFYAVWCDYFIDGRKVKLKGVSVLVVFIVISFVLFIGLYTFDTVVLDVLKNNRLF